VTFQSRTYGTAGTDEADAVAQRPASDAPWMLKTQSGRAVISEGALLTYRSRDAAKRAAGRISDRLGWPPLIPTLRAGALRPHGPTEEPVARLVRVVAEFWRGHGYGPSVRELGHALYVSPSSVEIRLRQAEAAGLLKSDKGTPRSIRLAALDTAIRALYGEMLHRQQTEEAHRGR
jgi:hypothetical protein